MVLDAIDIVGRRARNDGTVGDYEMVSACIQATEEKLRLEYVNHEDGKKYKIFPVRIEYTFLEDEFYVCALNAGCDKVQKIRLADIDAPYVTQETREDIQEIYEKCIREMECYVEFDISQKDEMIEKCFRIFSCYNRESLYDAECDSYHIRVAYYATDGKEIQKCLELLNGHITN